MFFIQNRIWPIFKGDKVYFTDFFGLMAVCKKQKVFFLIIRLQIPCMELLRNTMKMIKIWTMNVFWEVEKFKLKKIQNFHGLFLNWSHHHCHDVTNTHYRVHRIQLHLSRATCLTFATASRKISTACKRTITRNSLTNVPVCTKWNK